jgi:hypothetical protein
MRMNISLATERCLKLGKFTHKLSDEQLEGMGKSFKKANELIQPFESKLLQIQQNRNLSSEGKLGQKEIEKAAMLTKISAWKATDLDRSGMIVDLQNRQIQKVASTRKAYRPENDVLSFLIGQEIRQNHLSQQKEFEKKINIAGATFEEKQESGPLLQALMSAATGYVAAPRTQSEVDSNKRHEATLTALLDSPMPIVPDDYKNAVAVILADKLAANEGEQLREAIAFNESLNAFADDITAIVNQA